MTDRIRVSCPGCSKTLAIPASAMGKSIACPSCKGAVHVPRVKSAERPPSASQAREPDEARGPGQGNDAAVRPPRKARVISAGNEERSESRHSTATTKPNASAHQSDDRRSTSSRINDGRRSTRGPSAPAPKSTSQRRREPVNEYEDDPFGGDALYSDGQAYDDDNPYATGSLPPRRGNSSSASRSRDRSSHSQSAASSSSANGSSMNQILGGLAAMVGAIIWFVAGLVWMDRIFIYPPIMFFGGLFTLAKGVMGRGD